MGDLDYNAKVLGLPHYQSEMPCSICQCTKNGTNSYKNNQTTAPWLKTFWAPDQWRAWSGRSKCIIFDIAGLSGASVAPDWMHAAYLGAYQYIFASILYVLCFDILDEEPIQNLKKCWDFLLRQYKNSKCRHSAINKLSFFVRKSGAHKLRGKAGEIKNIAKPMLKLWTEFHDAGNDIHKKILLLMITLVDIETLLAEHSGEINLPEAAYKQFVKNTFLIAQLQQMLSDHFQGLNKPKVFSATSKTHQILHAALYSKHVQPSLTWCFGGEDYMRKIQNLGQSTVRGVNPHNTTIKMANHYRLGLHLHFEKLRA